MQVVKAPDSRLRIKTKPIKKINQALKNTLKEMIKLTKTFKDPEGVGLAATQIGLQESFFVARLAEDESKRARLHDSAKIPPAKPDQRQDRWRSYDKEFVAIINPKILSYSKRTKPYFEGCLSVPTIWGQVRRHTSIKVSYEDIKGHQIKRTLKGIPAWIFQHEVDHLQGILFTERVLQQKGKFYKQSFSARLQLADKYTGKDKTGTDLFEEVTI